MTTDESPACWPGQEARCRLVWGTEGLALDGRPVTPGDHLEALVAFAPTLGDEPRRGTWLPVRYVGFANGFPMVALRVPVSLDPRATESTAVPLVPPPEALFRWPV